MLIQPPTTIFGRMTIRFRLGALLEAKGLSQRELARRAGVSPTTVNHMVSNTTAQVSLRTLDRLAAALGVEPGEVFERDGTGAKRPRTARGRSR